MAVIHSLKNTVFILAGERGVIHCFSNSFSSSMLICKKTVASSYAFIQSYYCYIDRILAPIHSFHGTVPFSDVKICSHLILLTYLHSAYSRKPGISYPSSYMFRAASIILKWEQPLEAAIFW